MKWTVTNYEFIRNKTRLKDLLPYCSSKTLLVLDESSAVKNYRAAQTKACMQLRNRCGRIILLNGTPVANSPLDMFSQGQMLSPRILDCPGITHFRARYAIMGGYEVTTAWGKKMATQILKWVNLDDLQRRFAPYVLRRLKKDCLDLPGKLPPVTITVPLSDDSWRLYREMRDDMVAWLNTTTVSSAPYMITKLMRLNQITSGFLGGIEADVITPEGQERPTWLPEIEAEILPRVDVEAIGHVQEIGREKLDITLDWLEERWAEDPNLKIIIWCLFRPEMFRLHSEIRKRFLHVARAMLHGNQHRDERDIALRLLDPRTAPRGAAVVCGTYGTGAKGLNFTAAHVMLSCSYDYNLERFLQSSDRIDRPGQTVPCSYFDIEATGPKGQKTINHTILKARRTKENLATWTQAAWVAALREEQND